MRRGSSGRCERRTRMDSATRMKRIAEASRVLASYEATAAFSIDAPGRVWFQTKHGVMYAQVQRCSGSLVPRYGRLGLGGTGAMAAGQLTLWIRNRPHLPIRSWQYWASEKVQLCTAETVRLLEATSYPDPKMTCCVRCGSASVSDWWCLGGVVGPCCAPGRCEAKGN
jgi:hypothetical protein